MSDLDGSKMVVDIHRVRYANDRATPMICGFFAIPEHMMKGLYTDADRSRVGLELMKTLEDALEKYHVQVNVLRGECKLPPNIWDYPIANRSDDPEIATITMPGAIYRSMEIKREGHAVDIRMTTHAEANASLDFTEDKYYKLIEDKLFEKIGNLEWISEESFDLIALGQNRPAINDLIEKCTIPDAFSVYGLNDLTDETQARLLVEMIAKNGF